MPIVSAVIDLMVAAFPATADLSSISYYLWIVGVLATLTFQYRRYLAVKDNRSSNLNKKISDLLFPSIDGQVSIEKQPASTITSAPSTTETGPQPCSTGLTTRLLPFKNEKGEIDWVFSDDIIPGNELDAFKVSSMPIQAKFSKPEQENDLSPVTSNSSTNDSLSGKKSELSVLQIHTPSSSSSEDHKDDENDLDDEGADEAGDQNYQCPHCSSSFKMRGYLTRHLKKHSSQKAYKCPFHNMTMARNDIDGGTKCHPTGGFSRRDTYKTHLKSRHFRYPRGTVTKERNTSPGTCGLCGEWFQNAEIWTEIHIEGAECKYLPPGFKGKSRIKNRLKKQMARLLKEQKLQMKAGLHQPQQLDHQSPVFATPNSTITPMFSSANDFSDSPTHSILSSVGPSTAPSTGPYTGTPSTLDHFNGIKSLSRPHTADMTSRLHIDEGSYADRYQDYDDEYCLDVDQMSYPIPPSNTMMPPDAHFGAAGMPTKLNHGMPQFSH